MHNKVFAVLDTETTGFSPQRGDKMVEIAALKIKGLKIDSSDSFVTLLDPQRNIPPSATRVNKITDSMVVGQPLIEDKVNDFIEFFKGVDYTLIHNASFDLNFINFEFKRIGIDFKLPNPICTISLSKILYPNYQLHNLDALSKRFGITMKEGESRHRALGDVIVTGEVFLKFYEENPMIFMSELENLVISK